MKKEQLVQDTPPLTTAICFECLQFYGNGCHKNLSALFYNNLAMTSPYWCPPSSPLLSPVSSEIWQGRARDTNIGDSRFNATQKQQSRPGAEVIAGDVANCIQRPVMSRAVIINTSPFKYMDGQMDPFKAEQTISFIESKWSIQASVNWSSLIHIMAWCLVCAKHLSDPKLELLLIRKLEVNCREILSEYHTFSFKKIYLKLSSVKYR